MLLQKTLPTHLDSKNMSFIKTLEGTFLSRMPDWDNDFSIIRGEVHADMTQEQEGHEGIKA